MERNGWPESSGICTLNQLKKSYEKTYGKGDITWQEKEKALDEIRDSRIKHKEFNLIIDCLVGIIERLFFTILVAFNITGFPIAMIAWSGVKIAVNWQAEKKETTYISSCLAFCSLIGTLLSLLFALFGGFICRGYIYPPGPSG